MSISIIQNKIKRKRDSINDLRKKWSSEKEKEARARKDINTIKMRLAKTKSTSSQKSKLSKLDRLEKRLQSSVEEQTNINKRLQKEEKLLTDYEIQLLKEQEKESKKMEKIQTVREFNITRNQENINSQLSLLKEKYQELTQEMNHASESFYDVFISHATEDKDELVRPLANKLEDYNLKVFYDENTFKIGDSKFETINNGIKNSKFGIIVLSSHFLDKPWPKYEYTGFITREVEEEKKIILPIWHNVSSDQVREFNPNLYDKFALKTSEDSVEEMAKKVIDVILPD